MHCIKRYRVLTDLSIAQAVRSRWQNGCVLALAGTLALWAGDKLTVIMPICCAYWRERQYTPITVPLYS